MASSQIHKPAFVIRVIGMQIVFSYREKHENEHELQPRGLSGAVLFARGFLGDLADILVVYDV